MYTLVIAEDEPAARTRLVNMINWAELGFHVEAAFSDGKEVLDYLKFNTPDALLTDIKMTAVSGIQIAQYIHEHKIDTHVVFLSGYEQFEYAQKALEYHVSHYLTKPVSIIQLKEVFRQLRDQLQQQKNYDQLVQEKINHYNRLINYEKQQFLADVYYGAITNKQQIEARLSLLNGQCVSKQSDTLFLIQVVLKNDMQYQGILRRYGLQELQDQLSQVLNTFHPRFEFYPISCDDSNPLEGLNLLGVLWESSLSSHGVSQLQAVHIDASELSGIIQSFTSIRAEIPTFIHLTSPTDLAKYAKKVGENEPIDVLTQNVGYLQLLREQTMLLSSYLRESDTSSGMELAHTLLQSFLRGGISFAQKQCIFTITKLIEVTACFSLVDSNKLYVQSVTPDIFLMSQPDELMRWFDNRISLLFCYSSKQAIGKSDTSIRKIMAYIQEHYNEDVTLSTIADSVYLHPTYISRLIKEQTGTTFTTLLTEIRMDKAAELLISTNLKVYQIAEKVGYNNLKYFFKVFKEVKGSSPSEYRQGSKTFHG